MGRIVLRCSKLSTNPPGMCAQLHPILCDPMHYSPPGSSFHGIFQSGNLQWQWVAIPSYKDVLVLILGMCYLMWQK